MDEKTKTKTSKFLSLVLRHEPERIGLQLDAAGWTSVNALLEACASHGVVINRVQLEEIVATSEKRRFALSDDQKCIRANQGHSVEVSLGYLPQVPPARLYHGTTTRFLDSIRAEGIRKGERHHVHLSADSVTAVKVGQRRGKPAVLMVNAEAMHAEGHLFYMSDNGVWLTDHVPAEFIVPASVKHFEDQAIPRNRRATVAQETVEICKVGAYLSGTGETVVIESLISAAVTGTALCVPEEVSQPAHGGAPGQLSVTGESTVAALLRMSAQARGHLACLDFASAKNPGGGFLGGAEAQEESLARSSALYPCLLAAPDYYERNRACRSTLYLDLAIWSPGVPFFRDDSGALLDRPIVASVITAPAPNAGAVRSNEPERVVEIEPTLRRRAAFVLRIAQAHNVRRLVLGAWGCGVFRNEPATVARAFAELLTGDGQFAGIFDEVVFAIYSRAPGNHALVEFENALVHGAMATKDAS